MSEASSRSTASEALADLVPLLLLPLGERESAVQRLAGGPRQLVGPLLAAGEALHGLRPLQRQLPDHMALVEGVLRIAGEQQPYVGGDLPAALVLLAGEPAGRAAAVVQREAGRGEAGVEPVGLGALLLQLLGVALYVSVAFSASRYSR